MPSTPQPTISIVLPTIGRPGLERTLDSIIAGGLRKDDQIVVLPDGEGQGEIADRVMAHSVFSLCPVTIEPMGPSGGDWGHPGRNRGTLLAIRHAIMYTQDDQRIVPGGITVIRECLAADPQWKKKPHIFQVVPQAGNLCPGKIGELDLGRIDADCVVLPRNLRAVSPRWGTGYNGDHDYIMETAEALGPFAFHMALVSINENYVWKFPEMFP